MKFRERHSRKRETSSRRVRKPFFSDRGGESGHGTSVEINLSPRKLVIAAGALVAMVWLAWEIIAGTAAYNSPDPQNALAWNPSETKALDDLAYREVTKSDGNLDTARTLAQRALLSSPIDARALIVLGLIAEKEGDQGRADRLMRLAGTRTWRDMVNQACLLKRDIQVGEFENSLSHIDAILRINPDFLDQMTPLISAFTVDQRSFEALEHFLGEGPPWRAAFLDRLSRQAADPERLVQLYGSLKASAHPPDPTELSPYLDRQIKDGRLMEAYQTWQETLAPAQRLKGGFPYNGDFTAPIDGLPFNWILRPAHGMDIKIVGAAPQGEGRALQIQFSGTRVGPFTVEQLMLLPPGEYRFTGQVRAEGLRTTRGLGWRVSCVGTAPTNVLAMTELVASPMPWSPFSVDFKVEDAGCRGQWVILEIADRTASERQIEGQVWYKNLSIQKR